MTTRSFLDAMSNPSTFQSPLQQAQSVVVKDDYEALGPLLALPDGNGGGGGSVKETDFVNPPVEENLLHVSAF